MNSFKDVCRAARRTGGIVRLKSFGFSTAVLEIGGNDYRLDTVQALKASRIFRLRATMAYVRRSLGAVVTLAVRSIHSLREHRTTSASAATEHRTEDDAGGDDPDDSDLPSRQRSEIEYLRSLTGRKGGILERTYRLSLLTGWQPDE